MTRTTALAQRRSTAKAAGGSHLAALNYALVLALPLQTTAALFGVGYPLLALMVNSGPSTSR
jgi:hypothetical protein